MLLLNGSETFFIDASASYTEKATQNDYMPVVSTTDITDIIYLFEKKKKLPAMASLYIGQFF